MSTGPADSWLWNVTPVPPNRPATPVVVARYREGAPTGQKFQNLPSLKCVGIHRSIGTDPGRAVFRYSFDGYNANSPQSIEQALSTSITLPETVDVGDELTVKAIRPDGTNAFLFHGRALKFGFKLDDDVELVEILAVGIAKDCWDTPIGGLLIRDSVDIEHGADIQTDVPAQFNPKGLPNATEHDNWRESEVTGQEGDFKFPTFVDPAVVRDPDIREWWTLAMAARYLIYRHYREGIQLKVPEGEFLDNLLVSLVPTGAVIDPADPTTYEKKPILVADKPITGRDWPTVLNDLVRDKGFGMEFRVAEVGTDGKTPDILLRLFRLQLGPIKAVYLQPRGDHFRPELSNVLDAEIERDATQVVNQWEVHGALERHEVSVILECGFPSKPADAATVGAIASYDKTATNFAQVSDHYRLFVFDETGEGHYAAGSEEEIREVASLDSILGEPDEDGIPRYACRRRKPIGELFSTDNSGKPRRYEVAISTNYVGTKPGIWDRTGTWQVVEGGYAVLKDRIGIMLTADNPNGWKVGTSRVANAPYPEGVCKVVESIAAPGAVNKRFSLRLTLVIEGDTAVKGTAERSPASVLPQIILRTIDARDRYQRNIITASSAFSAGVEKDTVRDDEENAQAEAVANRIASEAGILEGPITIGHFTLYYQIGDRVDKILGRGLGFRTDGGGAGSAGAVYPVIVGIDHQLEPDQLTVLHLSDQDGHRHKIEAKIRRGR